MDRKTDANLIRKRIAWIVSGAGTAVLAAAFALWIAREHPSTPGMLAAGLSVALFVFGCWRFVPGWIAFFAPQTELLPAGKAPKHAVAGVALLAFAVEALLFGVVTLILSIRNGNGFTFNGALNFWKCLDSNHYLDIAREWYVPKSFLETTEEWFQNSDEVGRAVQLVFLPGYPLVVYPVWRILGNDVIAGLLVSAAAFPAACCMLYKLLLLDTDHRTAFRTVVMLLLLPGGFFFLAPMSESLYLLLALATLYCFRKKQWLAAGLLSAYCAFTRTVGLLLAAPLILEWIRMRPKKKKQKKHWFFGLAAILAVPVGFLAYLWINKTVSGSATQFLLYQHRWWNQHLVVSDGLPDRQSRRRLARERVRPVASEPSVAFRHARSVRADGKEAAPELRRVVHRVLRDRDRRDLAAVRPAVSSFDARRCDDACRRDRKTVAEDRRRLRARAVLGVLSVRLRLPLAGLVTRPHGRSFESPPRGGLFSAEENDDRITNREKGILLCCLLYSKNDSLVHKKKRPRGSRKKRLTNERKPV